MSEQGQILWHSRVERAFDEWMDTPDGLRVRNEVLVRCYRLKRRGVKHYGIAAIFEAIRYDFTVGLLGDGEFRLNNNHRSLLARLIMDENPDLEGFFEIRELQGIN